MPIMHDTVVWITVANVMYLVSYSVRDILWLRILTVLGALFLIPYYWLQPTPLIAAIAWGALFIAINVFWIVKLILERRPVRLDPDEARLREIAFPTLTPREAQQLFAMGAWEDVAVGESIVRHDTERQRSSVIFRGIADAMYQGTKIAELREGEFVGEIDKNADHLELDIIVRQAVRVMCWPSAQLNKFLSNRPDAELSLERTIGFELRTYMDSALSDIGKQKQ